MSEIVLDAIDGTLRSIPPKRRGDLDMVKEAVFRSVRGAINEAWGKKPIVKVLMTVVDGRGLSQLQFCDPRRMWQRTTMTETGMIGRLNHVAIAVKDIAKATGRSIAMRSAQR